MRRSSRLISNRGRDDFHLIPAIWRDDWGLEITESFLVAGGAEPFCTYPRKLFVKP